MAQINNQTPKGVWPCDPRRGRGLRLVQFWVPYTKAPSIIDGPRSQCLALRGDPAEAEMLKFSELATQKMEGWL